LLESGWAATLVLRGGNEVAVAAAVTGAEAVAAVGALAEAAGGCVGAAAPLVAASSRGVALCWYATTPRAISAAAATHPTTTPAMAPPDKPCVAELELCAPVLEFPVLELESPGATYALWEVSTAVLPWVIPLSCATELPAKRTLVLHKNVLRGT
jgi:hypothetical protein